MLSRYDSQSPTGSYPYLTGTFGLSYPEPCYFNSKRLLVLGRAREIVKFILKTG